MFGPSFTDGDKLIRRGGHFSRGLGMEAGVYGSAVPYFRHGVLRPSEWIDNTHTYGMKLVHLSNEHLIRVNFSQADVRRVQSVSGGEARRHFSVQAMEGHRYQDGCLR